MTGYLPLADYGVIGDLHTAALVGRNGSVDWWCVPRFDGPAIFAGLLDAKRGGFWRIAPDAPHTSEQRYLPATNALTTSFHLEAGGVVDVTDFMPVGPARRGQCAIYRRVRGIRGTVPVRVTYVPRFHYGVRPATIHPRQSGLLATGDQDDVLALSVSSGIVWQLEPGVAEARFGLGPGDTAWLVARYDDDEVSSIEMLRPQAVLDETVAWWDAWLSQLTYCGPFRQEVERSALTLKLLQFEPSGAIVAAPTTSLPEWPGGSRNWDYRFTWLRDSAFVLFALDRLGFKREAEAYFNFFKRLTRQAETRHLQVIHAADGGRDLSEMELTHLEGYEGARPVRIGNGAVHQFQLDVYGELMDTLAQGHRRRAPSEGTWHAIRNLVDWVAGNWQTPDSGIWEARQEPRHHVFSKVMAWCALDRGLWLADRYELEADRALWGKAAQAVRAEILERGWDERQQAFLQAYGEPYLDASLLVIPKIHFLPPSDPRVRSTLDGVRRVLGAGPEELIYRYRAPDGLTGEEGAFVVCSFWMIQNVALTGDVAEAERLFRLLLRRGGPLGLFAEEIDPRTGDALGNFPLGLSHAGVVNTAVILEVVRGREGVRA